MAAHLKTLVYVRCSSTNKAVAETKPHYSPHAGDSGFATLVERAGQKGRKKNDLLETEGWHYLKQDRQRFVILLETKNIPRQPWLYCVSDLLAVYCYCSLDYLSLNPFP